MVSVHNNNCSLAITGISRFCHRNLPVTLASSGKKEQETVTIKISFETKALNINNNTNLKFNYP